MSVYANVGSDFPELHKAVVELKGALEEFESAYAPSRTKSGRSRKESTPIQQKGGSGSRTSTPAKEARGTPVPTTQSNMVTPNQTQEDNCATGQRCQEDDDSQLQMPPPRILQTNQQQHEEGIKEDERQPEPPATTQTDRINVRAQSVPRYAPESNPTTSRLTPNSIPSSPNEQQLLPPRERVRMIRDRSADAHVTPSLSSHLQAPGSELMRKRQEYTASLSKANRNSTGAALGHHTQHDDEDEQYENDHDHAFEQRRPGSGGGHGQMGGAFLNNSVFGAKKLMGSAPVAPMMHIRKDGGGANGANGTGRRRY